MSSFPFSSFAPFFACSSCSLSCLTSASASSLSSHRLWFRSFSLRSSASRSLARAAASSLNTCSSSLTPPPCTDEHSLAQPSQTTGSPSPSAETLGMIFFATSNCALNSRTLTLAAVKSKCPSTCDSRIENCDSRLSSSAAIKKLSAW